MFVEPSNKNIHEAFFTLLDEQTNAYKCKKCGKSIAKTGTGYTNTVKHAKNHPD